MACWLPTAIKLQASCIGSRSGITQGLVTHALSVLSQADEEVKLLDANLQTANASMYSMQKELSQYESLEADRADQVCHTSLYCSMMRWPQCWQLKACCLCLEHVGRPCSLWAVPC